MKGHTDSTLPRTKYVKCFSPGASALRQAVISYCYRLVPRLKFIVIKRKVILSNVKQKCGPLSPGSAVNLNKLNLIEIELFIKTPYEVWSSLQPNHETNKYPRRMQVTLGRRSETFEEVISFLFRG